jgi:phosphoglycerate dehydrogenase-like enzyme
MSRPRVYIGPEPDTRLSDAVHRAGGTVTELADAEMIVWRAYDPEELRELLHPGIRWVQLAAAGVDRWLRSGVIDDERTWMSGAGTHSENLAEHALALILAGLHRLGEAARATHWDRSLTYRRLRGLTVAVIGAGGIGRALIAALEPFDVEIVAVTRRGVPVQGAARTLPAERVAEVWPDSDVIVLCAPATAATHHLIDRQALAAVREGAWIVNVARGTLIDTDALLEALDTGGLGGAALDVTDPEPLPEGHPLWRHPRVLITPHVGDPPEYWTAELAARVQENVARLATGSEPLAIIDRERGY